MLSTLFSRSLITRLLFHRNHYCCCGTRFCAVSNGFVTVKNVSTNLKIVKFYRLNFSVPSSTALIASRHYSTPKEMLQELLPKKSKGMTNYQRNQLNLNEPGKPTWLLKNVFTLLGNVNSSQLINSNGPVKKPVFEFSYSNGVWKCNLILFYPTEQHFEGFDNTKKRAEDLACLKAINWMIESAGVLSKNYNPVLKRADIQEQQLQPFVITEIKPEIQKEMNELVNGFNEKILEEIVNELQRINSGKTHYSKEENATEISDIEYEAEDTDLEPHVTRDIITGRPFTEPRPVHLSLRSARLLENLTKINGRLQTDAEYKKYMDNIKSLPVYDSKAEILEAIENNRVTVIAGETASGKTTQIPLLVFEDYIAKGKGSQCSTVITQPRRLPAISVSEQVAYQFGEGEVGNSIGYQIRFAKTTPKYGYGAMLFCTSGVLLRKLWSNPDMKGVSHVFIDEVHERDVVIDFLLVLIKRLLNRNKDIKVILMSATINAKLFSDYFDNCPVVQVKGRLFPVRQIYLQELSTLMRAPLRETSLTNPKIDQFMIAKVIQYIDCTMGDGSILCFLPGWAEIADVRNQLEELDTKNPLYIVPVHSQLPHSQQKLIFNNAPSGMRKVVLSTNIAETSITVPDVVYVIDPGLCKEIHYNKYLNVSSFGTHWISKANAKQREGRAGRVQSGYCFKLYDTVTEQRYMNDFAEPELLRVPLESVVMQSKFYCPSEKTESFLSNVPQPPSAEAVVAAIQSLKAINVLDDKENMTKLGEKIVHFTTHPRLSVSLVYASLFGCLEPMLNVVAALSGPRDLFQVSMDERSKIKEIKMRFASNEMSDHVAVSRIVQRFEEYFDEAQDYCRNYSLHFPTMNNVQDLKKMYRKDLVSAGLIQKSDMQTNQSLKLMEAALLGGLYANVIRVNRGELVNGVMKCNKQTLIDVKTGGKLFLTSDSVLNLFFNEMLINEPRKTNIGDFMFYVVYFNSYYSLESKRLNIKDGTVISPLSLLLFAGKEWVERCESSEMHKEPTSIHDHLVTIDNNPHLQFKMTKDEAILLRKWRLLFCRFVEWFLLRKEFDKNNYSLSVRIEEWLQKYIFLTNKLLRSKESETKNNDI